MAVLEFAFVAENIPSQPAREDEIAPAVTAIAVLRPNAKYERIIKTETKRKRYEYSLRMNTIAPR